MSRETNVLRDQCIERPTALEHAEKPQFYPSWRQDESRFTERVSNGLDKSWWPLDVISTYYIILHVSFCLDAETHVSDGK